MGKMLVWVVIVLALIGGAFALANKDSSKPLKHIEKPVPDASLGH